MLDSGTRLGIYEVVAPLGAGGMGEVYRARDTRLNRAVAIKILPSAFVGDPDRIARFEREAQLLAAVNHPHIAAIYGLEQSNSLQFLVLELVDGATLAERLTALGGRPLGVDEALAIARQIADALQAAHDKGIVHRDLKPANIAITSEGQVKVLDFGLAKLDPVGPEPSVAGLPHSPTLTFAATQAGMILGTAAYMSPEQARGKTTDKRTDVWAFACVLYEMLTGRRAFDGDDATETIAAIVRGEPDWSALPASLPPEVTVLLRRSLEKDRQLRVADISTARFLLAERIAPSAALPKSAPPRFTTRQVAAFAVAAIAASLLAAAGGWVLSRRTFSPAPRQTVRFSVALPPTQSTAPQPDRDVVISPDGTRIVYRIGRSQVDSTLAVRGLNDLDARVLSNIGNLRSPFISADSRWIGYYAGVSPSEFKKIPIDGGTPATICKVPAAPRGATWGPDGTIVFATADIETGLFSVSADGGDPKPLTTPDQEREGDHVFPSFLPGGTRVLYTILPKADGGPAQIAVLDLKSGARKTILTNARSAEWVPGGYLAYMVGIASVRLIRFDLDRLETNGDPVTIIDRVLPTASAAGNFSVSATGSLAYISGVVGNAIAAPRSLVWVDRQGREQPIGAPVRSYGSARLSPDGGRIAVDIRDQDADIWTWDMSRGGLTRITADPGADLSPVWTPDGRRLAWASTRNGATSPSIYWQSSDGTGTAERLSRPSAALFPTAFSPDGTRLVMFHNSSASAQDIGVLQIDRGPDGTVKESLPIPLIHSPAVEVTPDLSPDGRWIAYTSNESGRPEIYVRPFPDVNASRVSISTDGGSRPVFARNGRELFYLDADNLLTEVDVDTSGGLFRASRPRPILKKPYVAGSTNLGFDLRAYDVSADGQRFLMLKDETPTDRTSGPMSIVWVVNWSDELKAK